MLGDDEPPLNLASRADCLCIGKREDGDDGAVVDEQSPCVQICGHDYTIDNAADFSNILTANVLQPSRFVTGNDVQLVQSPTY